jgi:carbonic anhydrase/acetyltransferase-like protein (isoleucine patch superfamily)
MSIPLAMPPEVHPDCFIASTAIIIGEVKIEKGASIWYGAVLRGDEAGITIGEGTNIQDNVTVHTTPTSPVTIGNNCSIGHGAVVHGCKISDNVIIGINSTILDYAEIHSGSIIGANALVKEGQVIPENSLAVGVPAKIVRENEKELLKAAVANAEQYHFLRDQHKSGKYEKYKIVDK